MKIALIVGGWYFPKHLYKNVIEVNKPEGASIDFFVVSHRDPTKVDIGKEMLPRIKENNKYDLELFNEIITYTELQELGYTVDETENAIGDYYFFNQWTDLYNYKEYEYVILMHDDNYVLPDFKDILTDIFSYQTEFYRHNGKSWEPYSKVSEIDYIANSVVPGRKTARGSFSIWSKRLLKKLKGEFSMENVEIIRKGQSDTPTDHWTLDWNTVGTNFQSFVQDNDFEKTSFRLSEHYRSSKYTIEGERGLISNMEVRADKVIEGLLKLKKNMKKNVILFTSLKANDPNLDEYKEWALLTWKYYAKKYDIEIFMLEEPLMDVELMRPTWQRWYVYDILKHNNIEFNKIALVDIDTMVRWDCPNIFEAANGKYAGVKDDISLEWINNSIDGYRVSFEEFKDVNLDWTNYINNGVLVLPENGEEFCNIVTEFYTKNVDKLRDLQHHSLKKGTDQTPINFLAKKFYGDDIQYLSKKLNMSQLILTQAFAPSVITGEPVFIKHGSIWHFNGIPRDQRNSLMKQTWDIIKHNYEDTK